MFTYVFWLGVVILAIMQIGLCYSDLYVPLNADVGLYSSPAGEGLFSLSSRTHGGLIDAVTEYRVLENGLIVGRTTRRFFVIAPAGEVKLFADRPQWLKECGAAQVELGLPSRYDDPYYWMAQKGLIVCAILWFVAGIAAWGVKIRSARDREY